MSPSQLSGLELPHVVAVVYSNLLCGCVSLGMCSVYWHFLVVTPLSTYLPAHAYKIEDWRYYIFFLPKPAMTILTNKVFRILKTMNLTNIQIGFSYQKINTVYYMFIKKIACMLTLLLLILNHWVLFTTIIHALLETAIKLGTVIL